MAKFGTCSKCQGTGRINSFSHIAGGICFDCKGTGQIRLTKREIQRRSDVEAIAKRHAELAPLVFDATSAVLAAQTESTLAELRKLAESIHAYGYKGRKVSWSRYLEIRDIYWDA